MAVAANDAARTPNPMTRQKAWREAMELLKAKRSLEFLLQKKV
jgi:hypothetical protein